MAKAKLGTYYLSRIIKVGLLDDTKVIEALQKPLPIVRGTHGWTITKFQKCECEGHDYYFAKLTKYKPDGEVSVIDHEKGEEVSQIEPDLVVASSPFVFIPSESAFSHLHVWNQIGEDTFKERLAELIMAKHQHFFVDCSLESIADLRTFLVKIKELEQITHIAATIFPPNPLFSPAWESLKDYLKTRKTEEMKVEEKSSQAINTDLPAIVSEVLDSTLSESTTKNAQIGDAAILMAADGYGRGKIVGTRTGHQITVRTSEATLNFQLEKDPNAELLFRKTFEILQDMNKRRNLKHK